MKKINIYIGYDEREAVAYHVLCHSILTRTSSHVAITPLVKDSLRKAGLYTRPDTPNESTAFTYTRFLVPWLSGFWGYSIFMDCDMLVRCDIAELIDQIEEMPRAAVMCCQHDYVPKDSEKFLGNKQTAYPKKNWSSLMVFRNALCKNLTTDYVNSASGMQLHRFMWVEEDLVKPLPLDFNWLMGEYSRNPNARILHYTLGGPWFPEYRNCEGSELWLEEYHGMVKPAEVLVVA